MKSRSRIIRAGLSQTSVEESEEEPSPTRIKTRSKVVCAGLSRAEKLREIFSGRRSYRNKVAEIISWRSEISRRLLP
jgi:hypothetical protein